MRRLLKGDIRRILLKKSFYISLLISVAAIIVSITVSYFYYQQTGYTFLYSSVNYAGSLLSVMGLVVFMGVFADEFKNMALSNVIGRGFSRIKVVAAKLLDSVIIMALISVILVIVMLICGKVLGAVMTPMESRAFFLSAFLNFYDTVGAIAIAAMFIFISGNISLGIFMYLGVIVMMPVVFFLIDMVPVLTRFHFPRYSFSGMNYMGFSGIMMGCPVRGTVTLLINGLFYIGISVAIMIAVFRKKELEF